MYDLGFEIIDPVIPGKFGILEDSHVDDTILNGASRSYKPIARSS